MALEIIPFDATEFLDTEESQTHLIEDAFESGDAGYIAHALGVVAKARGMSQVARDTDGANFMRLKIIFDIDETLL